MSKRFKGLRNRNRSEEKAEALAEQETSLKDLTAQGLVSKQTDDFALVAEAEQSEAATQETVETKDEPISEIENKTEEVSAAGDFKAAAEDQRSESATDSELDSEPTDETEPREMVNGDDPDKIPVKPTLQDDQVPNMPGAILRHAREMLGMSQREVATELKLRVNTISDLEHDRLNQPTAAPFASAHIANYARLVNIDPEALLTLYRQNVNDVIQANNQEREAQTVKGGHGWLLWSILGLAIMGVAGYYLIPANQPKEQSGTLQINNVVQAEQSEPGQLNLDLKDSAVKTEIVDNPPAKPVKKPDENTRRAQEQALALGTNEINEDYLSDGKSGRAQGAVIKMPSAGSLKLTAPATTSAVKSANSEPLKAQSETKPQSAAAAQPQTIAQTSKQTSKQTENVAQVLNHQVQAKSQPESTPASQGTLAANQEHSTPVALNATSSDKVAEPKPENSVKEPANVKLASSLKDISGSAKLRGKQGLESMNKVSVAIRDAVALRITDSRGKTLANGSYKAGDKVTVNGIPPIKIAVSDSAKIKITYMGGQVTVPSQQQVVFNLPTK